MASKFDDFGFENMDQQLFFTDVKGAITHSFSHKTMRRTFCDAFWANA